MNHLEAIFASYVVAFCFGAYVWWQRKQTWQIEALLFVMSTVIMPVIYLVMFDGNALFASNFAPQFPLLVFIACCGVWPMLKRDPRLSVLAALAFVLNVGGFIWTYLILHSHPDKL